MSRRCLLLWGAAVVVVFMLVAVIAPSVATRLNEIDFASRPEFENWADPSRGTVALGFAWGVAAGALTAAVAFASKLRRARRTSAI